MKTKRITCFISSLASGGAERQLAYLANFLSEKGYEVSFVTCLDEEDHYTLSPEIRRIRIKSNNSNLRSAINMIKFFSSHQTDVIISFRERMNLTTIIGCLGRDIKIIAGERNFTIDKPTKVGYLLQNYFYRQADYIVANSYSQASYLKNLHKSWEKRVRTIINYTDINKYKKVNLPDDDQSIQIGVFARFAPQKNCITFIKALKKLKITSNKTFEIHWYGQRTGKINYHYYEEVLRTVKENDVEDIFFMHDAVKDIAKEMNKFHAVALPSYFEGFSNSVAEGICCGKPMLVSDVSDNSLMVHDGENGFLFSPNNEDSIFEALKKFLELSSEERIEMGVKSRELANELFNAERFVNSYINLVEN